MRDDDKAVVEMSGSEGKTDAGCWAVMRGFGHRRSRLGQGGQLILARTNAVWLILYGGHYHPMTRSMCFVPHMHRQHSTYIVRCHLQPQENQD
jgi:hypothetical protein